MIDADTFYKKKWCKDQYGILWLDGKEYHFFSYEDYVEYLKYHPELDKWWNT